MCIGVFNVKLIKPMIERRTEVSLSRCEIITSLHNSVFGQLTKVVNHLHIVWQCIQCV